MKNLSLTIAHLILERRKTKKISSAIRRSVVNQPPTSLRGLAYGRAFTDPIVNINRDSSTV